MHAGIVLLKRTESLADLGVRLFTRVRLTLEHDDFRVPERECALDIDLVEYVGKGGFVEPPMGVVPLLAYRSFSTSYGERGRCRARDECCEAKENRFDHRSLSLVNDG